MAMPQRDEFGRFVSGAGSTSGSGSAGGKGYQLDWKGADARSRAVKAIIAAVNELHLEVEREAKAILQPGHGVITGTARRSIHADSPTYTWGSDDVPATPGSPERQGTGEMPAEQGNAVVGTVGSGLIYAMPLHEGHGSFSGYQFITRAHEKMAPKLPGKLEKHARLQGLK